MAVPEHFTAELDLKFFEQREFEPTKRLKSPERNAPIARNALRILMMGWNDSWREFLTFDVFSAIFIKRDSTFLREMRFAFQEGLLAVHEQLKDKDLTKTQHEQVQLYLSNCLSLLPYSDITPYESIKMPQYFEGKWELVEYVIKPIELTSHKGIEGYFIRDADRVFAYGLEPLIDMNAEPHLVFLGTTYPAGQGFLSQILTDSKGFETVGKTLYRTGREHVQAWLTQQKKPVHVCGTSLGGALSLLLAMDEGDYTLSRVDALNPPGLHDARSKSRFDHWDKLKSKGRAPIVVVQKEGDDPVSGFGVWKPDWLILRVVPAANKGPNGLSDHALNYAGLEGTQFTYVDATLDSAQRKQRNFWLYSLGRSVVYYGLLLPLAYIVRPITSFIANHWKPLLVLACFALIVGLTLTGGALGLALAAGISCFMVVAAVTSNVFVEKKPGFAKMHDPKLPRNKTMDIYADENSIVTQLTYSQVGSYYQAMRGLVKDKPDLPEHERESKHVKGMTKRELLEACREPANADLSVEFCMTKAKKAQMNRTFSLIGGGTGARVDLLDVYDDYHVGKSVSL